MSIQTWTELQMAELNLFDQKLNTLYKGNIAES